MHKNSTSYWNKALTDAQRREYFDKAPGETLGGATDAAAAKAWEDRPAYELWFDEKFIHPAIHMDEIPGLLASEGFINDIEDALGSGDKLTIEIIPPAEAKPPSMWVGAPMDKRIARRDFLVAQGRQFATVAACGAYFGVYCGVCDDCVDGDILD